MYSTHDMRYRFDVQLLKEQHSLSRCLSAQYTLFRGHRQSVQLLFHFFFFCDEIEHFKIILLSFSKCPLLSEISGLLINISVENTVLFCQKNFIIYYFTIYFYFLYQLPNLSHLQIFTFIFYCKLLVIELAFSLQVLFFFLKNNGYIGCFNVSFNLRLAAGYNFFFKILLQCVFLHKKLKCKLKSLCKQDQNIS
jgi:hypothetical protein